MGIIIHGILVARRCQYDKAGGTWFDTRDAGELVEGRCDVGMVRTDRPVIDAEVGGARHGHRLSGKGEAFASKNNAATVDMRDTMLFVRRDKIGVWRCDRRRQILNVG